LGINVILTSMEEFLVEPTTQEHFLLHSVSLDSLHVHTNYVGQAIINLFLKFKISEEILKYGDSPFAYLFTCLDMFSRLIRVSIQLYGNTQKKKTQKRKF